MQLHPTLIPSSLSRARARCRTHLRDGLAVGALEGEGLHLYEVHQALVLLLQPHGQLHRRAQQPQLRPHLLYHLHAPQAGQPTLLASCSSVHDKAAPRLARTEEKGGGWQRRAFQGLAPARSHLLMKARRGTSYRRICRSTVMLWLCSPPGTRLSVSAQPSTHVLCSTCVRRGFGSGHVVVARASFALAGQRWDAYHRAWQAAHMHASAAGRQRTQQWQGRPARGAARSHPCARQSARATGGHIFRSFQTLYKP